MRAPFFVVVHGHVHVNKPIAAVLLRHVAD